MRDFDIDPSWCLKKTITTHHRNKLFRHYRQSLSSVLFNKELVLTNSSLSTNSFLFHQTRFHLFTLHVSLNENSIQIDSSINTKQALNENIEKNILDPLINKSVDPLDSWKRWKGSLLIVKIYLNNQSFAQLTNLPLILFLVSSNFFEVFSTPFVVIIDLLTFRRLRNDLSKIINAPGVSFFTLRDLRQNLTRLLIPLDTSNLNDIENCKRKTNQFVQSLAFILCPILIYRLNNKLSIQNRVSNLIQIVNKQSDYLSLFNKEKLKYLENPSLFLQTRQTFDLLRNDNNHSFTTKSLMKVIEKDAFSCYKDKESLKIDLINKTVPRALTKFKLSQLSNLLSLDELAINILFALKDSQKKRGSALKIDRSSRSKSPDNVRAFFLWKKRCFRPTSTIKRLFFVHSNILSKPTGTHFTLKDKQKKYYKNKSYSFLELKKTNPNDVIIERYSMLRSKIVEHISQLSVLLTKPSLITSFSYLNNSSKETDFDNFLLKQNKENLLFDDFQENGWKRFNFFYEITPSYLTNFLLKIFNNLKFVENWLSEEEKYISNILNIKQKENVLNENKFTNQKLQIFDSQILSWIHETKNLNYSLVTFDKPLSWKDEKDLQMNQKISLDGTKHIFIKSFQTLLNWTITHSAKKKEKQENIDFFFFDNKEHLSIVLNNCFKPYLRKKRKEENSFTYRAKKENIKDFIQKDSSIISFNIDYLNRDIDFYQFKQNREKVLTQKKVSKPLFQLVSLLSNCDVNKNFLITNTLDFLDYVHFCQSVNEMQFFDQKMSSETFSQNSYHKLLAYSSAPSLKPKKYEKIFSTLNKKEFSKNLRKNLNLVLFNKQKESNHLRRKAHNLTEELWQKYFSLLNSKKTIFEQEKKDWTKKENLTMSPIIQSKIWQEKEDIHWQSNQKVFSKVEHKLKNQFNSALDLMKFKKEQKNIFFSILHNLRKNNNESILLKKRFQQSDLDNIIEKSIEKTNSRQSIQSTFYSEKNIPNLDFKDKFVSLAGKNRQRSLFSYTSNHTKILKKYIQWVFTPQWWLFFGKTIQNLAPQIWQDLTDSIKLTLNPFKNDKDWFNSMWDNSSVAALPDSRISLQNLLLKENSLLWKQIRKGQNKVEPIWSSLGLLNHWHANDLAILSWLVFGYLAYCHYFSNFIGAGAIDLWRRVEKARHLRDPSFRERLDILMHNSNDFPSQKSRWKAYISNKWILFGINITHKLRETIYYPLIGKKFLKESLTNNISLDLSRRQRELVVQCLITDTQLVEYGLEYKETKRWKEIGYRMTEEQGLHYLQQLARTYHSYPNYKQNQNNIFIERWLWSAFHNNTMASQMLWEINDLSFKRKRLPISVQSGQLIPKGILLIGPKETGKSYLVKSLAADSQVPLVYISINKLIYNKPDFETKNWTEVLKESLKRLMLILDLAKKLSPCIVWIPDIHELSVNRFTEEAESDPGFLLSALLRDISNESFRDHKRNILFVGSSHLPGQIDPALMSSNRLDKLIHVRMPVLLQRRKDISTFLRNKQFVLKNKNCLKEVSYKTMGYNQRDLAGLANEILLIAITQSIKIVNSNTVSLALHRQTWGSTYVDEELIHSPNSQVVFYKVGRAIIQNTLLNTNPMLPLYARYDLWKMRFYYLSKAYIEPSFIEPAIKEFTILPHVLSCLAGSAARDVWLLLRKNSEETFLALDNSIENDFNLAASLFETIFLECNVLDICSERQNVKKTEMFSLFKTRDKLQMLNSNNLAIADIKHKNVLLSNKLNLSKQLNSDKIETPIQTDLSWSHRTWRLNLNRSSVFNWTRRPNDLSFLLLGTSYKRKEESFGSSKNRRRELLPYERIFPKKQERKIWELESQLDEMLSKEQTTFWGSQLTLEPYLMEHKSTNDFVLFTAGRFVWNPISFVMSNSHDLLSHRDLLVNKEMLRKLYVTYGAKRERDKSRPSRKIRQFFLRHGYNRQAISKLSTNLWNKTSSTMNQDFHVFRKMIQVGAQLKRPQLSMPVYMYQGWLIENPRESFARFGLLNNRNKALQLTDLSLRDPFVYGTLLESYNYLFEFFFANKALLNKIVQILFKEKYLSQEQIDNIIYSYKWISDKSA